MCDYNQFTIALIAAGDDAAFHVKDAPGGEVHRRAAAEQSVSGFTIQSDLLEVIHGSMTPQGDPATLIIMEFRFQKMTSVPSSRRFRAATIKFRFFDPSNPDGGKDPAIVKIAPHGVHSSNITPVSREVKRGVGLGLQSGVEPANLVTLAGEIAWESNSTLETTDKTIVSGLIMHDQYRSWGSRNVAMWSTSENPSQKDGVPSVIRAAVLLQRKADTGQFQMETEVEATVDMRYNAKVAMQKMFGRLERDDAVTFDPDPKVALPTDRADIDRWNLRACQLDDEVRINPT